MKVPAAARSIARPPATEPVKLTWSTRAGADQLLGLRRGVRTRLLEQALRQAGASNASGSARRRGASAPRASGCTALPAISAGHDGVDRGEIGIVPGRDDEHDAERLARDHSGGSRPSPSGTIGRERLLGDRRPCSARAPRRRASRRHSGPGRPICQASSGDDLARSWSRARRGTAARAAAARSASGTLAPAPCCARAAPPPAPRSTAASLMHGTARRSSLPSMGEMQMMSVSAMARHDLRDEHASVMAAQMISK